MKVARSLSEAQHERNSVVTVGTFDGVHCAHREIIREVIRRAKERNGRSVVITFDPHPKEVVSSERGSVKLLTSIEERISWLEGLGVDLLFVIKFTFAFSRIAAEEFYRAYIVDGVGASEVVVGYDHMFGRDRRGTVRELEEMGKRFGFSLVTVSPFLVEGEPVSSTRVRKSLAEGAVDRVMILLGHPYSLQGRVVEGDRRGASLGFATANIEPVPSNKAVPGRGVYVVRAHVEEGQGYGMMNIGVRPTVAAELKESLEVHLLDFDQDIYGKLITIEFLRKLRDERKFSSFGELAGQLEKDREETRLFVAGLEDHR